MRIIRGIDVKIVQCDVSHHSKYKFEAFHTALEDLQNISYRIKDHTFSIRLHRYTSILKEDGKETNSFISYYGYTNLLFGIYNNTDSPVSFNISTDKWDKEELNW